MTWQPTCPRPPRTDWQERNAKPRIEVELALVLALAVQTVRAESRNSYADYIANLSGTYRPRY